MRDDVRATARDWRLYGALAAMTLVALLSVVVVKSIQGWQQATAASKAAAHSEETARAAAVRRVDQLLAQIERLQQESLRTGTLNSARIAELELEVQVLEQQIRDMGGRPIVTGRATTGSGSTTSPRGSTPAAGTGTPSPTRSPTPVTPHPTATPSPSPTGLLCRLTPLCLPL